MQSLFQVKSSKVIASTALALSVMLAGCSQGGAESASATADSVPVEPEVPALAIIQGNAVKGAISNGLVSAYPVELNNGVMVKSSAAVADPVRTDALGAYSLALPQSQEGTVYVIEVGADELTRMTCDVTAGCGTRESGSAINFGDTFPLSNEFSLQGVAIIAPEGQTSLAYLSPLTHMMVAHAESEPTGLTLENIQSSKAYIETTFDLDSGSLDGALADITRLDEISGFSQTQLEYGVVSAAILAMVNSPDWTSIDDILSHVAERLAAGAEIVTVNTGALRDLALDDVFYRANEIASDISLIHTGDEYGSDLAVIVAETQASYDSVAVPEEVVEPVQILSHPAGVTLDEGARADFSVSATGGGELAYQWRLNGQNLAGENASSLSVTNIDASDAGSYDVIISNSVGSVTSSAAVLSVNVAEEESNSGDGSQTGGAGDNSGAGEGSGEGSGEESGGEPEEPAPAFLSASLSWAVPAEREDGSSLALFEIASYEVRYGTTPGQLNESIMVEDSATTEAVVDNLLAGETYYFAIATRDQDGMISDFTAEMPLTIEL